MRLSDYEIITRPIITEKSMMGVAEKKYTFKVNIRSTKIQIKKAIENIFNVKVQKVTTINCVGKQRRVGNDRGMRPDWKKAVVKLTSDSKPIELFEGIG